MTSVPWNAPVRVRDITFELTNRCNLKCRICGIWRERPIRHLAPSAIARFLDLFPRLDSVSLTGGEALLHPEFNAVYRDLFRRTLRRQIAGIDLATNAAGPRLSAFLDANRPRLGPLTVSVSLDGLRTAHDRQRGVCGAFDRTMTSIRRLRKEGVPVSLKFTASALNYRDLARINRLAASLKCPLHVKAAENLTSYYHRSRTTAPVLTPQQRQEWSKALDVLQPRDALGKLSVAWHKRWLDSGSMDFLTRCLTPEKSLFITCRGDIYNCLYQPPVGNIQTSPFFTDPKTARANIRRGATGRCPKCLAYHGSIREFNLPAITARPCREEVPHGR